MRLAGRLDEALLAASDYIELLGDSGPMRNLHAVCLHAQAAMAPEDRRLPPGCHPSIPVLIGNLGAWCPEAGRLDEAVATLRRALSLNPSLGLCLRTARRHCDNEATKQPRQKNWDKAEAVALRRTNDDPFDRRG